MRWLRGCLGKVLQWAVRHATPRVSVEHVAVGWRSVVAQGVCVDVTPADSPHTMLCRAARVSVSWQWSFLSLPSYVIDVHDVHVSIESSSREERGNARCVASAKDARRGGATVGLHSLVASVMVVLAQQATVYMNACYVSVTGEQEVLCARTSRVVLQSTDASFRPLLAALVDANACSLFYRLSVGSLQLLPPSSSSGNALCETGSMSIDITLPCRLPRSLVNLDFAVPELRCVVDSWMASRMQSVMGTLSTIQTKASAEAKDVATANTMSSLCARLGVVCGKARVELPDFTLAGVVNRMDASLTSTCVQRTTLKAHIGNVALLQSGDDSPIVRIDGCNGGEVGVCICVSLAARLLRMTCDMGVVALSADTAFVDAMSCRSQQVEQWLELYRRMKASGQARPDDAANESSRLCMNASCTCHSMCCALLDVCVRGDELRYVFDVTSERHQVSIDSLTVSAARCSSAPYMHAMGIRLSGPYASAHRAVRVTVASAALTTVDLVPYEQLKASIGRVNVLVASWHLDTLGAVQQAGLPTIEYGQSKPTALDLHVLIDTVELDAAVSLHGTVLDALLCDGGWQLDLVADVVRQSPRDVPGRTQGGRVALTLWADNQLRHSPFAGRVKSDGLGFSVHVQDAVLRADEGLCTLIESLYDLAILFIYASEDTHVYLREDGCTMAALRGSVHVSTSEVTLPELDTVEGASAAGVPSVRAVASGSEDVVVEVDRYADKHMNVHVRLGPGASLCLAQNRAGSEQGDGVHLLPQRRGRVAEVTLHLSPCHAADLAFFPYTRLGIDVLLDHCAFVIDLTTIGAVWAHFCTPSTALWRLRSIASRVRFSDRPSRGRTAPPLSPTSSYAQARGLETFLRITGTSPRPALADYTESVLPLDLTITLRAHNSEILYPWETVSAVPLYTQATVLQCNLTLLCRDECLRLELQAQLSAPRVVTSCDTAVSYSSPLCRPLFSPPPLSELGYEATALPWQPTALALSLVYTNDARPPFQGGLADERYRISIAGCRLDEDKCETGLHHLPLLPLQLAVSNAELAAWTAALSFVHGAASTAPSTANTTGATRSGTAHSQRAAPVRRYFVELRLPATVLHLPGPRLTVVLHHGLELTSSPLGLRVCLTSASLFCDDETATPQSSPWTGATLPYSLDDLWHDRRCDEMPGALLSVGEVGACQTPSAPQGDSRSGSHGGEEERGSRAHDDSSVDKTDAAHAVCITSSAAEGVMVNVGAVRVYLCLRRVALWCTSDAPDELRALHSLVQQHRQYLDSLQRNCRHVETGNLLRVSPSATRRTTALLAAPAREAPRIQITSVHILCAWRSVLQRSWVCLAGELHTIYLAGTAMQATSPNGACPDTTAAPYLTIAYGQIGILKVPSQRLTRANSPRLRHDSGDSAHVWQTMYTLCSSLTMRTVFMTVPDSIQPSSTQTATMHEDVPCILIMPISLIVEQAAYILLYEMAQQAHDALTARPGRAASTPCTVTNALVAPIACTGREVEGSATSVHHRPSMHSNTAALRSAASSVAERQGPFAAQPVMQEGDGFGVVPPPDHAQGIDKHTRLPCEAVRLPRWMLRLQSLQVRLRGPPDTAQVSQATNTALSPVDTMTTATSEAQDERYDSVCSTDTTVDTRSSMANRTALTPVPPTRTAVTRLCVCVDDVILATFDDAMQVTVCAFTLTEGDDCGTELVVVQQSVLQVVRLASAMAPAHTLSDAEDGGRAATQRVDVPMMQQDSGDDVTYRCARVCLDLRVAALLSVLHYLVQVPSRTLRASQRVGTLRVRRITERVWTLEDDLRLTRRGLVLLFSQGDTNHILVDMNAHSITIDEETTMGGSGAERVVIVVEAHLTVTFTNGVWRLPLAAMTASLMDDVQRDGVAVALLPFVATGEASFVQCARTRLTFAEPARPPWWAVLPRLANTGAGEEGSGCVLPASRRACATSRPHRPDSYGGGGTAGRRRCVWHVGLPLAQITVHVGSHAGLLRLATAAECTLQCVDGAVAQSNACLTDLQVLLRRRDGSAATVLTRTSVDLCSQRGRHHAVSVSAVNVVISHEDVCPARALVADLRALCAAASRLIRSAAEVELRGVIAEVRRVRRAAAGPQAGDESDEARPRRGAPSEAMTDADVGRGAGRDTDSDTAAAEAALSLVVYTSAAVLTLGEQRYPLCRIEVDGVIARHTSTPPGLRTLQLRCESCRAEVYGKGSWDTLLRRGEALSWCITDTLSPSSGNRHLQFSCAGLQLHGSHLILAKTLSVARQLTRWAALPLLLPSSSDQDTSATGGEGVAAAPMTPTHRFFNAFDTPFYVCVGRAEGVPPGAELLRLSPTASVDISVPYAGLDECRVTFFTSECVHVAAGGRVELNAKGRAMNVAAAQTRVSALRYGTAVGLVVDEDVVVLSCVDESRTGRVAQEVLPQHRAVASEWGCPSPDAPRRREAPPPPRAAHDAVEDGRCERDSAEDEGEAVLPRSVFEAAATTAAARRTEADLTVVRIHPKVAVCNETGYTLVLHQRLVAQDGGAEEEEEEDVEEGRGAAAASRTANGVAATGARTRQALERRCLSTGADCPLFHACVTLVVECALNTRLYRGALDVRLAANGHLLRLVPCAVAETDAQDWSTDATRDERAHREDETGPGEAACRAVPRVTAARGLTNTELHTSAADRRPVVFVVAVRPLAESLSVVLTLYPRLALLNHTGVPLNIALFQHDAAAGPAMDLDVALVQAWQQNVAARHAQRSRPEVSSSGGGGAGETRREEQHGSLLASEGLVALAAHHRLQHRQSLAINRCSLEANLVIGLSLSQSSGESIRTVGLVELVHDLRAAMGRGHQHARQLTLRDAAGKAFQIQVSLLARTIVLSVAVWVHNLTEYPLLMSDAVLTRSLFAGLSPTTGIAPSQGTPFLVGTALQNFRQVFFTIGLDAGWSTAVMMDVGASGSFESWQGKLHLARSCNYVVQLPDPQEARPVVVLITPRWVFYNHTSKRLQLYFDFPGLTKAVQRAAAAGDTEAATAMSTVASIQLNPGEYHVSCVGTIEGNRLALRERLEGTLPSVTSITDTAVQHKDAASFYESRRTGFLLIDGPTHATFNLWAAPRAAGRQMAVMYGEPVLAERKTVVRDASRSPAPPTPQMTPVDEYDRDAVVTGRLAVTVQALRHSLTVTLESIHSTRIQVQNRLRGQDVMVHQAGVGHRNLVPAQQNRFFLWEDSRAEHVLRVHAVGQKGVWYEVDFTQGGCRVTWHDPSGAAQTAGRPFYVHGRTSADRNRVLLLVLETALPRYAELRRWHTSLMLRASVSFFQLLWSYEASRSEAAYLTQWQSLLSLALEGMSAEWLVTEENSLGVFFAVHQLQFIDEVRRRVFVYRARLLQPLATTAPAVGGHTGHSEVGVAATTQAMPTSPPPPRALPYTPGATATGRQGASAEAARVSASVAESAPYVDRTEGGSRSVLPDTRRSAPVLYSGGAATWQMMSGRRRRREARLAEHSNDVQLSFNAIRYADGMLRLSELEASLTPFVLVLTDAWLAQVMREWHRVAGAFGAAQRPSRRTGAAPPSALALRPAPRTPSPGEASVLLSRTAFVQEMIELLEERSGSRAAVAEDMTGTAAPPLPVLARSTTTALVLDRPGRGGCDGGRHAGPRSRHKARHDALGAIDAGHTAARLHLSPHQYALYLAAATTSGARHGRRAQGRLRTAADGAAGNATESDEDEGGAALARFSFILVERLSVAPVTLYVTLTRHHPDPLRPFLGAYTLMLPQQLKQTAFYLSAFTLQRRVETGASLKAHVAAWARKGLREQWTKVTKVGAVLEVLLWWQRRVALRSAPAALTLAKVSYRRDAAQGGSIAFFSSSSSSSSSLPGDAAAEAERGADDATEEQARSSDEEVVAGRHGTNAA